MQASRAEKRLSTCLLLKLLESCDVKSATELLDSPHMEIVEFEKRLDPYVNLKDGEEDHYD